MRASSYGGPDVVADETDDVLGRGARGEELFHAHGLEGRDVIGRDDAAAEDRDVFRAFFAEQFQDALEEVVVGAREDGEPDRVGVFLDGRGHNLLRRLVKPGIDDLEARVAERARDNLGTAVMPVQPRFRDHQPDLSLGHDYPNMARIRSAMPMISSRFPVTSFQSNPFPSFVHRGMRCRWKCGTDWKAAPPLAWSRLSPSGFSAFRMAPATFFAVTMAALRSSGSASYRVAAWALVATRQCPRLSGLMSMKASVR